MTEWLKEKYVLDVTASNLPSQKDPKSVDTKGKRTFGGFMCPHAPNLKFRDPLLAAPVLLFFLPLAHLGSIACLSLAEPGAPSILQWLEGGGATLFLDRFFVFDIGALAIAIPLSFLCSRIGFFGLSASLFVGSAIGFLASGIWAFGAGLFATGALDIDALLMCFIPSGLYGAASSLIFRSMLALLRPEAFAQPASSMRYRAGTLAVSLLFASPLFVGMAAFRDFANILF